MFLCDVTEVGVPATCFTTNRDDENKGTAETNKT